MILHEALDICLHKPAVIAFVGAGGKTTAMFRLAHELKVLGKKVLVTTTTNIAQPEPDQCDVLMLEGCVDMAQFADIKPGTVLCLGGGLKNVDKVCKVQSIEPAFIDELYNKRFFDCILVEADGAKHKPIKAPADHEPVIPSSTTMVIGVIGLDALGTSIDDDTVHRSGLFCSLTGKTTGDTIDREALVRLIAADNGLFKNASARSRKIVLLNKADTAELRQQAELIAQALARLPGSAPGCIIASLQQGAILQS